MSTKTTKIKLILLMLSTFLLSLIIPQFSVIFLIVVSIMLGAYILHEDDFISALAIGIASLFVGIILLYYVLSLLKIKIAYVPYILTVLVIVGTIFSKTDSSRIMIQKRNMILIAGITLIILLPKIFFFKYPAYPGPPGVDSIFHALKIKLILEQNTVFVSIVHPYEFPNIVSYPAGYHSVVSFLVSLSKSPIPYNMMILRIILWVIFPLASYYLSFKITENKDIAFLSMIITPSIWLYYYYINYTLHPTFFNYYLLPIAIGTYIKAVDGLLKECKINTTHAISIPLIAGLLFVHPYHYIFFQIYATIYTLVLVLNPKYNEETKKILFVYYILQGILSFLLYYVLSSPARINIIKYSTKFSTYPEKDNVDWLRYIILQTFIKNANVTIGPLLLVSFIYGLRSRSEKVLTLILSFISIFVLMLNKIFFKIYIPVISAIWNSERLFILLTPILPVLYSIGLYRVLTYINKIEVKKISKKTLLIFVVLLIILPPYVSASIDNIAFEEAYILDNNVIQSFEWIKNNLSNHTICTLCCDDSGYWMPVFGINSIKCLSKYHVRYRCKLLANYSACSYLYLDTRGMNVLYPSPLDPLELYKKYQLVYFNKGIWIFNLSSPYTESNLNLLSTYYTLSSNTISPSVNTSHLKYFIYGWIIKHPIIIKWKLLKKLDAVYSLFNKAEIIFIPNSTYNGLEISMFSENKCTFDIRVNDHLYSFPIVNKTDNIRLYNVSIYSNQLNSIIFYRRGKCSGVWGIKSIKMLS